LKRSRIPRTVSSVADGRDILQALEENVAVSQVSQGENRMPVKVMIPTPLRAYAGKQESVQLQAGTVGEALSALTSQFADLKKHLFTDDGRLRSFVNVYVNDEDIRYLQKDQTPVREGDVVSIVPSIAGGARDRV
jgi:molybdopterin converting factor small subunit